VSRERCTDSSKRVLSTCPKCARYLEHGSDAGKKVHRIEKTPWAEVSCKRRKAIAKPSQKKNNPASNSPRRREEVRENGGTFQFQRKQLYEVRREWERPGGTSIGKV